MVFISWKQQLVKALTINAIFKVPHFIYDSHYILLNSFVLWEARLHVIHYLTESSEIYRIKKWIENCWILIVRRICMQGMGDIWPWDSLIGMLKLIHPETEGNECFKPLHAMLPHIQLACVCPQIKECFLNKLTGSF